VNAPALVPRLRFAALPTPVEPLPRLSAELKGPIVLAKRDDLTGLAFGGNKARKLEFVMAEAQAHGTRTLITTGAAQSNHCRQTAALAARLGIDCILVLSGDSPPQPTGNLLLNRLFGAQIVWTGDQERQTVLRQTFEEAWSKGRRPYLIPLGASTPLGALGFEAAFREILQQSVEVDWIVLASSSGGTQAGLALGARRAGWPGKVLGISVDQPAPFLQSKVASLATAAAERLDLSLRFDPEDILVNAGYFGAGYGVMGQPEREAVNLFARLEGLLLDPVYTAKAAAGLCDLARKGCFKPGQRILFWHTGGTPALFADRYQDL